MLSLLLKKQTAFLHQETEKHPWVKLLFKGSLPMPCYIRYLLFLLPVYRYLEEIMAHDGRLCVFLPELARASRLYQDVLKLTQNHKIPPLYKENPYLLYLYQQNSEDKNRFIAHFYVRYFGDLSGGRLFCKILQKKYGLTLSQLNYYDFSLFLQKYPKGTQFLRDRLDNLPLSLIEKYAIAKEAQTAFKLTQHIMSKALFQTLNQ